MAKKKKNPFYQHDFESAREAALTIGRDIHMDLKVTIDRIEKLKLPMSEQSMLDHSPWLQSMVEDAKRNWIKQDNPHLKQVLHESAADFQRWVLFFGYGEQNFRLWPTLCEALLATDFKCPRELLKLPYPYLTFQVPQSIGRQIPVRHEDGTSYPASTIYMGLGLSEKT